MNDCNNTTKRKITNEKLEEIIKVLHQLKEEQNFQREEEINKVKVKAEKTNSDTQRKKALDKIKAIELLKDKIVFDNYKTICEKLSLPILAGDSKVSQMNELHRIFEDANFTEEELTLLIDTKVVKKTAIVIDKIYDEPLERVDGRTEKKGALTDIGGGIYKIQLDNRVYIGQTNKFIVRLRQHKYNYKNNPKTNELLKQGAIFEPLEIIENTQDKNFMYTREQYWYEYYKNLGYDMINTQTPMKSKVEELKRYKGKKVKRRKPYIYKHFKIKKEDYSKLLELLKDSDIQLY